MDEEKLRTHQRINEFYWARLNVQRCLAARNMPAWSAGSVDRQRPVRKCSDLHQFLADHLQKNYLGW